MNAKGEASDLKAMFGKAPKRKKVSARRWGCRPQGFRGRMVSEGVRTMRPILGHSCGD